MQGNRRNLAQTTSDTCDGSVDLGEVQSLGEGVTIVVKSFCRGALFLSWTTKGLLKLTQRFGEYLFDMSGLAAILGTD